MLVLFLSVAPGFVAGARGQANSDFIAYPKSMVNMDIYKVDPRQLTFNRLPGLSADYQLGAGDQIEVTIVGVGPKTYKISESGEITIPPLGNVKVAGLTAVDAEATIAAKLKEEKLLSDPEVLIYISSYEAKPVYVVGDLDRPGEFMMSQQLTLMDLIFIAGGVDLAAGRYGYLHRRLSPEAEDGVPVGLLDRPDLARPGTEVIKVDLQPMKDGSVLNPNYSLRRGDVFVVPRRQIDVFYVIGDVGAPGAFRIAPETHMSVSRAIAIAGGPTKTAKMSAGIVVRYASDGTRSEFPVDFAAILTGRQPDIPVQPNDVIFIPGSSAKTMGYGLIGSLPGILSAAIFLR